MYMKYVCMSLINKWQGPKVLVQEVCLFFTVFLNLISREITFGCTTFYNGQIDIVFFILDENGTTKREAMSIDIDIFAFMLSNNCHGRYL